MSELDDLAKFISEATGEPCEAEDILHIRRAKEPLDGSPLESVVQGRPESPVPSNPDRSGDAILAKLRARAMKELRTALRRQSVLDIQGLKRSAGFNRGTADTLAMVLQWLDELAPPSDNTAGDTKSSSAGVH